MMTTKKIDSHTTIYMVDICKDIDSLEEKIKLSSSEFLYYSKITAEKRRCEWLTSRILIREIFGDNFTTDYRDNIPIVVDSDKHISISHCKDKLLLMVSDRVCGVDIERSDNNFLRVSKRFLSSSELEFMDTKDIALAWTIKEAAYKMIGVKEIDFGTMFIIKEIDYSKNKSILIYDNTDYELFFYSVNNYNISYGMVNKM